MSRIFNMTRDVAGNNGFGVQPSKDIFGGLMAPTTVYTVTVPSNYPNWIAVLNYTPGATVWVSFGNTAAIPAVGVNPLVSELNPTGRQLVAGETISLITSDTNNPGFSVLFYVISPFTN